MGRTEGGRGARSGGLAGHVRAGGLLVWAALAASPAAAMDWTIRTEAGLLSPIVWIEAQGEIVTGDVERLQALVADYAAQAGAAGTDPTPTVHLNSPGGDPVVGIELALAIRALGLDTFVPVDAACGSACTIAFLGGVQRRVMGVYAIHAARVSETVEPTGQDAANPFFATDSVQHLAQVLLLASRDLIGDTQLVEASLTVRHIDAAIVPDELLRDWQVITHAMRPDQRLLPDGGLLSGCDQPRWANETLARSVMCDNIAAIRQHGEIGAMVAALTAKHVSDVAEDQERFEAAWQACGTEPPKLKVVLGQVVGVETQDPRDIDFAKIDACVAEAVAARHRELTALTDYFAVIDAEPARSGWKTKP